MRWKGKMSKQRQARSCLIELAEIRKAWHTIMYHASPLYCCLQVFHTPDQMQHANIYCKLLTDSRHETMFLRSCTILRKSQCCASMCGHADLLPTFCLAFLFFCFSFLAVSAVVEASAFSLSSSSVQAGMHVTTLHSQNGLWLVKTTQTSAAVCSGLHLSCVDSDAASPITLLGLYCNATRPRS